MFWPDRLKVPLHRQLVLYVALPLAYIICGRLGLLLAGAAWVLHGDLCAGRDCGGRDVRRWHCNFAWNVFGFIPAQYLD